MAKKELKKISILDVAQNPDQYSDKIKIAAMKIIMLNTVLLTTPLSKKK